MPFNNVPRSLLSTMAVSEIDDPKDRHRRSRQLKLRKTHGKERRRRVRSESPPPKHRRRRDGRNKGHPKACPFCRPEIHKRMAALADSNRCVQEWRQRCSAFVDAEDACFADVGARLPVLQLRDEDSSPEGEWMAPSDDNHERNGSELSSEEFDTQDVSWPSLPQDELPKDAADEEWVSVVSTFDWEVL